MFSKKKEIFLVSLILLAAAGVRFYGLDWGLPYHFNSDETILFRSTEILRTTPSFSQVLINEGQFFIYPPFVMHLLILLVTPIFAFHPFSPLDPAATTLYYIIGRSISASFGLGTVALMYILGKRAYSRGVGFLSATFLAFSVLHVRDSHFFTTDVPFTFFLVLLFIFFLRIMGGAGNRIYAVAGFIAGLGLATKPTILIALPLLLYVHFASVRHKRPQTSVVAEILTIHFWSPLLLFGGVTLVTLLVMNPYPLIAPREFLRMSLQTSDFVTGINQPNWVFQFTATSFCFWFTNLLWFGMGSALEAASLLGALWAFVRRKPADLLILIFLALYLGFIGSGFMKFIRYALPLIPFLALLGARFLLEIVGMAKSLMTRTAVLASIATVAGTSLFITLAYLNIYRQQDVRIQASRWIYENIPRGTTVLVDNSYTTPLLGSFFIKPSFFDRYNQCLRDDYCVREDYYTIKVMNLTSRGAQSLNPPERFAHYLDERFQDVEYLIMGDEFPEQYGNRQKQYTGVARFYGELFSGRYGFREVKNFKSRPALFGIELNDDRAELTFRLFDHPLVRIFERERPTVQ
jgi:4-amino-4-deoxy-L-arabinose transferase-like glycosyltransferase